MTHFPYERIDLLCSDIQSQANLLISKLERLAGELREAEIARKNFHDACSQASADDTADIDAALDMQTAVIDELPELLEHCEMEVEEFIKLLDPVIHQVFDEIREMMVAAKTGP